MKVAVQLYTLRNELSKDFLGTMKEVSRLGYNGVEFAGFYDIPSEEMKSILDHLNLEAVGSHTALNLLENNLDEVISYNKTIGNKNIIVPIFRFNSIEEVLGLIEKLNHYAKELAKHDLVLHYHNHAHELVKHNDQYILDLIFEKVPTMFAEIDTHWVTRAGLNPVDYLKQYNGRTTLVHLKDLEVINDEKHFAPLGTGIMDFKSIIEQAKENQAYAIIVENDKPRQGGINDIEISMNYLKQILGEVK